MASEEQAAWRVAEAGAQGVIEVPADRAEEGLRLSAESLRRWGARSAFALTDQAFTSGAGFLINLLLARWLSPALFGAFAVAFAANLFLSGFHNVLLLEPMSVMGPSRYATSVLPYFRTQVALHFLIVGGLSVLGLIVAAGIALASPGNPLTAAIVGGALALPFYLLLWLVRRMCYVEHKPATALWGSAVYLGLIVIGLFALRQTGKVTPFWAFALIGAASIAASLHLFLRLTRNGERAASGRAPMRAVAAENWKYGRWLVGSAVLYSVCNQIQLFLVAGSIGLSGAGALRAMQLPALLVAQVITATGLLVLPSFAHDFGLGFLRKMHQRALLLSGSVFLFAACFACLLWLVRLPTESVLFGGRYSGFSWLMPVLALVPAANALGVGLSMALRASRKPQFDLVGNIVAAPVAILSAYLFIHAWGLVGAAGSMVLSFLITSVVTCCFYAKWRKETRSGVVLAIG